MLQLSRVHHIAIISSDYAKSKHFYTEILGFKIVKEVFRKERQSYKLDLALNGSYIIELFSFPSPPLRPSNPEASGLRHIAFEVDDIDACVQLLKAQNLAVEPLRIDKFTNKRFTFFADPDNLPIELYEK